MEELTIDQLKIELLLNEQALREALNQGSLIDVRDLTTQRANLKDMLIQALEEKLLKVG